MLTINPAINSYNKNISKTNYANYTPNFNGKCLDKKGIDSIMPVDAKRLIHKMNLFIEKEWKEIRRNKTGFYDKPYYTLAGKKDEVATLTPIYQGQERHLLFEISKNGKTERIIINRQHPDSFKYEKIVDTNFGYATTKSFNSDKQRDDGIEYQVGKYVSEYFPKILASKIFYEI